MSSDRRGGSWMIASSHPSDSAVKTNGMMNRVRHFNRPVGVLDWDTPHAYHPTAMTISDSGIHQ